MTNMFCTYIKQNIPGVLRGHIADSPAKCTTPGQPIQQLMKQYYGKFATLAGTLDNIALDGHPAEAD